jgi:hypothetical protein
MRFGFGAGMGDGAFFGGADDLRVFPQRAGLIVGRARLPEFSALGELGVAHDLR